MSKNPQAIETANLSDDVKSHQDPLFNAVTLPDSTALASATVLLGQVLGGVEAKVVVNTGGTLLADVLIELQTSVADADSWTTQVSKTAPAGAVVVDDMLAGLILNREVEGELDARVLVTTTDTETVVIDGYLVLVP